MSKIEQLESEWARIWTKVVPIMLHYRNFPKLLDNSDFEQWSSDLHMCVMAEGRYYKFKQSFRGFISRLSASQNSPKNRLPRASLSLRLVPFCNSPFLFLQKRPSYWILLSPGSLPWSPTHSRAPTKG